MLGAVSLTLTVSWVLFKPHFVVGKVIYQESPALGSEAS